MNDYEIKLADPEIEQKINDFEGWLCVCGQFNEHEYHCDTCKAEPPWGCDCIACTDETCDEFEYWDGWIDPMDEVYDEET